VLQKYTGSIAACSYMQLSRDNQTYKFYTLHRTCNFHRAKHLSYRLLVPPNERITALYRHTPYPADFPRKKLSFYYCRPLYDLFCRNNTSRLYRYNRNTPPYLNFALTRPPCMSSLLINNMVPHSTNNTTDLGGNI